mmetsp:Transcript_6059/g.14749  ORF Transcript_6059/g.14749 Transcript_6059/m.14749 type:complete len:95 (-) Transcript_6059:954-1238(-)
MGWKNRNLLKEAHERKRSPSVFPNVCSTFFPSDNVLGLGKKTKKTRGKNGKEETKEIQTPKKNVPILAVGKLPVLSFLFIYSLVGNQPIFLLSF